MTLESESVMDDCVFSLSPEAIKALQEFTETSLELNSKLTAVDMSMADTPSMSSFKEDWQLSQFWYSKETCRILADEMCEFPDNSVACISCPSVFVEIKVLT